MRELTIVRQKSGVGCLSKMKVYIEDPYNCELVIKGIPCRKLGDLANGESKTFEIEERSLRVFVIAGKSSMRYCNDLYVIPEGIDNITLTGKNKFSTSTGHAFRFDNNFSEEAISNRMDAKRRGRSRLAICALVGFVIGFGIALLPVSGIFTKDRDFEKDGMTITLTNAFEETTIDGYDYTAIYDSRHVAVFVLKEPFEKGEEFAHFTVDEYIDLVIEANNISSPKKEKSDGLTYFTYDYVSVAEKKDNKYIAFAYKTDDAYWLIQFAEPKDDAYDYTDDILEWAKTVRFE